MSGFDLEAFKSGQPALTGDGRIAHFVYYEPRADKHFQLGALLFDPDCDYNRVVPLDVSGKDTYAELDHLVKMAPKKPRKRELWIRAYHLKDGGADFVSSWLKDANIFCWLPDDGDYWLDENVRLHGEYDELTSTESPGWVA